MDIVFTLVACLLVFAVQGWLLPFVVGIPLLFITGLPSRMVWRTVPLVSGNDMEDYAAEHPWRIHLAALFFRWGAVSNVLVQWALFLLVIYYLSERVTSVIWQWVYIVSFFIFLSALNNARTLQAQANSLSHRLRGGSSEFRYRHGQRDLPPDEVLGPIVPTRRGF